MSDPVSPFQPAIDALEKDLAALERDGNALFTTINVLRKKAGLPPRGPWGGGNGREASAGIPEGEAATGIPVQIRPDTFFGKRMGTAARELLEMRRASGQGPGKPRELFETLKAGGFQFEAKDDTVAIVSFRAMLRKNTQMFQKLPNGTYGLKAWYPNAKPPKESKGSTASDSEESTLEDTELAMEQEIAAEDTKSSAA